MSHGGMIAEALIDLFGGALPTPNRALGYGGAIGADTNQPSTLVAGLGLNIDMDVAYTLESADVFTDVDNAYMQWPGGGLRSSLRLKQEGWYAVNCGFVAGATVGAPQLIGYSASAAGLQGSVTTSVGAVRTLAVATLVFLGAGAELQLDLNGADTTEDVIVTYAWLSATPLFALET